ncbi:MAG: CocE/NonD family hydrolase, partial [Candidatus Bipolaricaulota bacterium]
MSETNGDDRTLDIIWDARVEMEDGVELSSDVYLSDSEDSFPAVLIRTPYNKSRGDEIKHGTRDVEFFVNHGYAVVIQDVRGRGDSEGEWIPFVNEGKDGYQTIEWIAKQSWCNGKVGMMGGSYRGFVQWAAARENPAPLTTMISTAAAGRWFQEIPFINGTVTLTGLEWLNFTGGRT